ncbi:MAG: hypothetical protein R3Y49_03600 [Rikenellaceae bacterium]
MEQHKKAASKVLTGLIISYGMSILSGILVAVWMLAGGLDLISNLVSSAIDDGDVMAMSQTLSFIQGSLVIVLIGAVSSIGQIIGSAVSYMGIRSFSVGLDEMGARGARNMTTGMLLSLIALCVGLLNWMLVFSAAVAGVCNVVALVFMIMGAGSLRRSELLSEMGRSGAQSVFVAHILSAVSIVAIIIPVIGWLAIPVLTIVSIVKNLSGWNKIRQSFNQ